MVEVSVVIPCLNEEKTVGICVEKCLKIFKEYNIDGEIIVVDNGSTDNSIEIAKKFGVIVIFEERKGYGSAYLRGFDRANGRYIIIGDADNTYDFLEIPKFLKLLMNDHCDFINGTRLNGKILSGAMPRLHRYIGNPLLTKILNFLFHANFSDALCGFKAFRRDALEKMNLKCVGMELTLEIIIKAVKANLKIKEVPITYYPREKGTSSKLRSFIDGFKYLKFIIWHFLTSNLFVL